MRTIDEILKLFPITKAEDWHQHPNGGGWVQNTAEVKESSYIGENAIVYGNARVCGNAHVCDNARVYGNARVHGKAWVYGDAWVYSNAWVCDNAIVYDNAQVYGNAWVYGDARVCGDARVRGDAQVHGDKIEDHILFIQGSKHSINMCTNELLRIGCEEHTIKHWLDNYIEIGEKHNYTEKQIEEYKDYIDLFAKRYGEEQCQN